MNKSDSNDPEKKSGPPRLKRRIGANNSAGCFFRNAEGLRGISKGLCRGCLSGAASWQRLELAHPPPDTNYCIASSASGCPIELPLCLLHLATRTYPRATNHPLYSAIRFQPRPLNSTPAPPPSPLPPPTPNRSSSNRSSHPVSE